jgi:hypothetical protein
MRRRLNERLDEEAERKLDDLLHMPLTQPLAMTDWRAPEPAEESERTEAELNNRHLDEPRKPAHS